MVAAVVVVVALVVVGASVVVVVVGGSVVVVGGLVVVVVVGASVVVVVVVVVVVGLVVVVVVGASVVVVVVVVVVVGLVVVVVVVVGLVVVVVVVVGLVVVVVGSCVVVGSSVVVVVGFFVVVVGRVVVVTSSVVVVAGLVVVARTRLDGRVVTVDESSGLAGVVVVPLVVVAAPADGGLVVRSAVVGVGLDVGAAAPETDTVGEENTGTWIVTVPACWTRPSVAAITERRTVRSMTVNPAFGSGATLVGVDPVCNSPLIGPATAPPMPAAAVPVSVDGGVVDASGAAVDSPTVVLASVSEGDESAAEISDGSAVVAEPESLTICSPSTSSGTCFGFDSALKAKSSMTSESANSVNTTARREGLRAVNSVMKGGSLSDSDHRTLFTTNGSEQSALLHHDLPLFERGEDLMPAMRDQDGVLPLGRPRKVMRDGGPVVVPHVVVVLAGHRQHWLDGERHTRLHHESGVAVEIVGNVRLHVKALADSVTDKGPHDAVAEPAGMRLDGVADDVDRKPGSDGGDAEIHGLMRDLNETAGRLVDRADTGHHRMIAVHAVQEDGDVDVDDVAVL